MKEKLIQYDEGVSFQSFRKAGAFMIQHIIPLGEIVMSSEMHKAIIEDMNKLSDVKYKKLTPDDSPNILGVPVRFDENIPFGTALIIGDPKYIEDYMTFDTLKVEWSVERN